MSIDATAEEDAKNSTWDIWIRDEEHLASAKDEFQSFESTPEDAKYDVEDKATEIRHQRVADQQRRLKNQQSFSKQMRSPQSGGGMLGGASVKQQSIPATIAIIIIAVIASLSDGVGQPLRSTEPGKLTLEERSHNALSFVDPREYYASAEDPFVSIKKGEVWRLVAPMLLHGDALHLAFNMIWIYLLGSAIERIHGSVFLVVLVVAAHVLGMLIQVSLPAEEMLPEVLSGLAGTPFAVGASGAVYGLFGYLWIRPNLDPSYPIRMVPQNVALMLGWLVLCIFFIQRVANGAHIGGLIGGVLAAMIVVGLTKSKTT